MHLQLRFQGDYAREFGAHPKGYKREWKAYYIVNNNEILAGEVYKEPDYIDGGIFYNLWLYTEYIGKFKTKKDLYSYLKNILM